MTTIYDIIKNLRNKNRHLEIDSPYSRACQDGYNYALDDVYGEIQKAIMSDSDWISPIPEERQKQEAKLKEIFPSYPKGGPKWQYMNGLLEMAMKQTS